MTPPEDSSNYVKLREYLEARIDDNRTYVQYIETRMNSLEQDVRLLRESRSLLEGKATQSSNTATFLAVLALIVAFLNAILIFLKYYKVP